MDTHTKAMHSSATNASWPQSAVISHLSHREQVRIVMACVTSRYPQIELGPENIASFKADWLSLLQEIGTERFLVAVERACQSTSFFPVLADIVKHVPPAPAVSTYSGPSAEDRRRMAAGERNYGHWDLKCLAALHRELRGKVGRPLTRVELDGLIADLDRRIDSQNQRETETLRHSEHVGSRGLQCRQQEKLR